MAEFSEHEADCDEAQERECLAVEVLPMFLGDGWSSGSIAFTGAASGLLLLPVENSGRRSFGCSLR
jgi:hypothetical protein